LDALYTDVTTTAAEGEYFPFIPIRLDNKSITHADYDDITGSGLYTECNRAYRRASGGGERFSQLVDQVEDNADIDDVAYAFTHHGVNINVIEPACRRYIFEWFSNIKDHQTSTSTTMSDYQSDVSDYQDDVDAMNDWIYAQGDPIRSGYGDSAPSKPDLPSLESTTIRLVPDDAQLDNIDMRISWVNITESSHAGAPTNPDTTVAAVEGEVWIEEGTPYTWDVEEGVYPNSATKTYDVEQLIMYYQTGSNSYRKHVIWGLVHRNFVYGGEAVKTTGVDALTSVDPTGFIIPLHLPTVKDLGIKDATQMATANTFIVFNSYEIVKQKWYEGFLGMIIIIIIILILVIVFAPAGGAAGGILGIIAAACKVMVFTGTVAIVRGAITNTLVGITIMQMLIYESK